MELVEVTGDLLDQEADVIVNPWNRNTIPWWLLLPQGVSGAIKKKAGTEIFKELARQGRLELGQAVLTSAGSLPYEAIIHVAGINDIWRSSEDSITKSVTNALDVATQENFQSVAMPIIGAGSGGMKPDQAKRLIIQTAKNHTFKGKLILVEFPTP